MKRTAMLILAILLAMQNFAQVDIKNNEIQTLFSTFKSCGFYGAYSIGYSQMEGKDALVTGGRMGLIFNHFTAVGVAGYGFFNNLDGYHPFVEDPVWYSLAGGYGGIFIEPIINGLKPVHLSFPILFGAGGTGLVRNYGPGQWQDPFDIHFPENAFFFVAEPAVELEFNLTNFFRTAVTLSYRFTSDVELTGKSKDVLQGLFLGLTFKLGKFQICPLD
ncbi:hypothetical protein D1164_13440 [Mariniphaga sediminis]|jgi:hypothetical protein|uniref:Outer membrane protein beta-barrel domain-containing protein n=1 Tax=Mariniphaga sediminis TaxID=1628158 RepID=A0A399D2N3_9BACT|nr:hypothetical protein [Mariniphaga sediminis]RIH64640.1 hypothetical protein D1164_13440 [Mariniphaga sediminis]